MSEHQQQQQEAPKPGTPEHDAAMVAEFEKRQQKPTDGQETSSKAERPAHIPEKFWDAEKGEVNVEALAKSYTELEKGRSQEKKPAGTEKPQIEVPDTEKETETPEQKAAREAAEGAGVNFDDAQAEYDREGKLADTTYEKLAKAGIPRATVDAYIAGQEALANQARNAIFTAIGGEENWAALSAWATANVPKAELVAFNQTLASASLAQAKLAVEGLYAKYTAANGKEPSLVNGNGARPSQGDVYRSTREFLNDVADPRYEKDPAFRADVDAKLLRSEVMGVKHKK